MTAPLYRTLNTGGVELLLHAIHRAMVNAKKGGLLPNQKLSVEHILPQRWEAHWPLDASPGVSHVRDQPAQFAAEVNAFLE